MLFFSEDGLLMYSDGMNCIELFGRKFTDEDFRPINKKTGEAVTDYKKGSLSRDPKRINLNGRSYWASDEEDDDEFAAIEPAGVDKNGNSMATHNIRPDKSKSSGRIFGMNGKQFVHSRDCDE